MLLVGIEICLASLDASVTVDDKSTGLRDHFDDKFPGKPLMEVVMKSLDPFAVVKTEAFECYTFDMKVDQILSDAIFEVWEVDLSNMVKLRSPHRHRYQQDETMNW